MDRRFLVAFSCTLIFAAAPAQSSVFFSEYVEGSSNNKALEIYNGTGAALDLTGFFVDIYFNGVTTAQNQIALDGTIPANDVFVIAHSSAGFALQADQTSGSLAFNGDDAVVLRFGSTMLDVIGRIGEDPPVGQWGSGLTSTADNTLRRNSSVLSGDVNGTDAFDPSIQWTGFQQDNIEGLGSHAVAAIPEPETYALLMAGLGLLGFAARRRAKP